MTKQPNTPRRCSTLLLALMAAMVLTTNRVVGHRTAAPDGRQREDRKRGPTVSTIMATWAPDFVQLRQHGIYTEAIEERAFDIVQYKAPDYRDGQKFVDLRESKRLSKFSLDVRRRGVALSLLQITNTVMAHISDTKAIKKCDLLSEIRLSLLKLLNSSMEPENEELQLMIDAEERIDDIVRGYTGKEKEEDMIHRISEAMYDLKAVHAPKLANVHTDGKKAQGKRRR
eukprot:Filipodium_phascolosomae@DN3667_c0_g1_i2.p1